MALVAYGDSDMSGSEDDESSSSDMKDNKIEIPKHDLQTEPADLKNSSQNRLNLPAPKTSQDLDHDIFLQLPEPKSILDVSSIIEEEDEFLKKKETPELKPPPPVSHRKPVKIKLTALSDFQEEDNTDTPIPQQIPTSRSSGLLGILPPPKQIICSNKPKRPMVPHILTKKPTSKVDSVKTKKLPTKKEPTKPKSLINYDSSDESDADNATEKSDKQSDFFSLNDDYKLPEISFEELNIKPVQVTNEPDSFTMTESLAQQDDGLHNLNTCEQENGEIQLDEEALRQLCGSRAKRYKPENIQIIDMSHEDVLPNREEWMREALQETTAGPRMSHAVKALGGPSSTQKRKHQITYLAHQAKANELELQNQWANNRMTRRQTQSKYGF